MSTKKHHNAGDARYDLYGRKIIKVNLDEGQDYREDMKKYLAERYAKYTPEQKAEADRFLTEWAASQAESAAAPAARDAENAPPATPPA